MKRNTVLLGLFLSLVQAPVLANALVGQMAPAFEATDSNGKTHSLNDFKGKYVVLEWTNYDCPFVKRQYGTNTMQNLQKTATQRGVVWLSVNSSAMGNQGKLLSDASQRTDERKGRGSHGLLDGQQRQSR
ncbi:redoxin domain-containing protein [Candidatus Cyanaurora vandensis]|uniref:redoxin domain-containing protein n=1 Tax=Candidatus Cyanaurora vandensis TaxID=2714958 RepID=UPI00257A481A|nr:redoxin domain-containing protein [Candidatus Cyanaurora vandensis]